MLSRGDLEIQKEAARAITNAISGGSPNQTRSQGGANPYAVLLLKCFGMNHFEFLQSHEYAYIYPEAFEMIKSYINVLV
ncbi:hypothetical protein MRX96_001383 [Rhipicephalus microplus]